jgi:hypothetical protein
MNKASNKMSVRHSAKEEEIRGLTVIPGVGKSIAADLWTIGIKKVSDLRGKNPELLFDRSNLLAGTTQDRCLLYVFRCAVYYAETPEQNRDSEKLKWWNWKDVDHRKGMYLRKREKGKGMTKIAEKY